jgi:hypothetical protein
LNRSCFRPAERYDHYEANKYIRIQDKLSRAHDILSELDGYQLSEDSSYFSDNDDEEGKVTEETDDLAQWNTMDGSTYGYDDEVRIAHTVGDDEDETWDKPVLVSDSIYSVSEYDGSDTSYDTATEAGTIITDSGTEYETETDDDSSVYSSPHVRLVHQQKHVPVPRPRSQFPNSPSHASIFSVSSAGSESDDEDDKEDDDEESDDKEGGGEVQGDAEKSHDEEEESEEDGDSDDSEYDQAVRL